MAQSIILVDFAGTLIKPAVLDEANRLRASILKRAIPTAAEHAHPDELYRANRELVGRLTGLETDAQVQYRENDLQRMLLSGEQVQNQMATNLFQLGMYMAAKRYGLRMFPAGLIQQLERMQKLGYKLAIVSGVREDIITGMFAIVDLPLKFNYVYGQPPVLGVRNEQNMRSVQEHGLIEYALGDKLDDLKAGKSVGAKTIFVTWGHLSGGEEEFADYTIRKAVDLEKIIK